MYKQKIYRKQKMAIFCSLYIFGMYGSKQLQIEAENGNNENYATVSNNVQRQTASISYSSEISTSL